MKECIMAGGSTRPNLRRDSQLGFTLIEMAIVLAVIGLIIGGILKGQEVINNARLKTQVAQIDAIKAATNSFQDKYTFWPGDFIASKTLGTSTSIDGDEDGYVATPSTSSGIADGAANGTEMNYALAQMQVAALIGGVNTTTITTSYLPAKIDAAFVVWGDFTPTVVGSNGKWSRIQGNFTQAAPTPALRTTDANAMDSKYDDGNPATGFIVVDSSKSTSACATGLTLANPAAAYTAAGVSGTARTCVMLISN